MTLRKPCEHGRYDEHRWWDADGSVFTCPGGEFLADDALITKLATVIYDFDRANPPETRGRYERLARTILDAFTVREGADKCGMCDGRGLLDMERDERGLQIGAQEDFCPACHGTGALTVREGAG